MLTPNDLKRTLRSLPALEKKYIAQLVMSVMRKGEGNGGIIATCFPS